MADTKTAEAAKPAAKPKAKASRGRPSKSRGAPKSSDKHDARWTVRGIPTNVRLMATNAAEKRGLTVGDWIAEAIVAHSRADEKGFSADGKSNLPAKPLSEEFAKMLSGIEERLTAIERERSKSFLGRLFGRHP